MHNRQRLWIIIDVLILGLLGGYIFAGMQAVPFHGDEGTLIAMSRDYYRLFHEGDFDAVMYSEANWNDIGPGEKPGTEQFFRITTGFVDSLTIGMSTDVMGIKADDLVLTWDWWYPHQYDIQAIWRRNLDEGNLPNSTLLSIARFPSTLFTVLGVAILYILIRRITTSRVAAWVGCLVYTLSPIVLVNGRRAMQEGAMLFFSALAVWFAWCLIQEQRRAPARWNALTGWAIGTGIACGLAVASKHNTIVLVAAIIVSVLFAPLLGRHPEESAGAVSFGVRHILLVCGAGVLSMAVFFIMMPIWWNVGTIMMLLALSTILFASSVKTSARWIWLLRGLAAIIVIVSLVLGSALQGLRQAATITVQRRLDLMASQAEQGGMSPHSGASAIFLGKQPFFAPSQYYEDPRWSELADISKQVVAYEGARLDGWGGNPVAGVLIVLLFIGGIWALALRRFDGVSLLIILWMVFPGLILWWTNILPWQRYYLPLIQPLAVFVGLGIWQIVGTARRLTARQPV